jgi:LuxR family transcriptional regulator
MNAGDNFPQGRRRRDEQGATHRRFAMHPCDSAKEENFRDALARAGDAQAAFDVVAEMGRRLGFEWCAYGVRLRVPVTRKRTFLISNYDVRWQQRYRDAGYLEIDPTVAHGIRSTAPLVWNRGVFRHSAQMWAEARAFDLCVGWAQSACDASGSVGMLTLARSHEPLSCTEIRTRGPEYSWLAQLAHVALSAALRRENCATLPELSTREIEVLGWMADGKTSDEIALLLRISVHTVNFHVRNVKAKLQAANKTAAVASAMGLGLLS